MNFQFSLKVFVVVILFIFTFFIPSTSINAATYCVCPKGPSQPPQCTDTNQACAWETYCGVRAPKLPYQDREPAYDDCVKYWVCTGGPGYLPRDCSPLHPIDSLCLADGALLCGPPGGGGSPTAIPADPTAPPGATPTNTPTPTPTPILGSILVRGHLTETYHALSCSDIRLLANGITGAQFRVDGPMWHSDVGTQTGNTYVSFPNQALPGLQTLTYQGSALSSYAVDQACWQRSSGGEGTGLVATIANSETLTWDISFVSGVPFFQTEGGDVYSGGTMRSLLPLAVSPRLFARTLSGSSPGVVNVGSSSPAPGYDFSIEGGNDYGRSYVSATNHLISSPITSQSLYPLYSHRVLSGSNIKNVYDPGSHSYGKPPYIDGQNPTIYTYNLDDSLSTTPLIIGDVAHTPWVIGDNEKIIIVANGDVTIRSPITITGNGFFSLIARGTVNIDPAVGGAWNSTAPVLEGIFVAGTGFYTGASTVAGRERLVIRGSVISDTMTLERNLADISGVSHNEDTSAELFIHSPRLVLATPDILNDRTYLWQEVSP